MGNGRTSGTMYVRQNGRLSNETKISYICDLYCLLTTSFHRFFLGCTIGVHYIPLNEDLSDVEEKMQWIIENDNEAAQIAHRGTLWITDLIYHPNAQRDDESIFDETFRRYKAHFVANDDLIP